MGPASLLLHSSRNCGMLNIGNLPSDPELFFYFCSDRKDMVAFSLRRWKHCMTIRILNDYLSHLLVTLVNLSSPGNPD